MGGTGVRAMVQTGPGRLELQELDRPAVGEDDALVRVEACGICGTDLDTFTGATPLRYPVIPGHEPVGRIEAIGDRAAARWRLRPGDRVVVEAALTCGRCAGCRAASPCLVSPGTHGFVPTTTAPGLWGGYAELLHLSPASVPHRIEEHVPPRAAALFNALAAGFAWGVEAAGLRYGDSIVVLGAGQRGLACVVAAKLAGARLVVVTGLGSRDAHKLELAMDLGADVAVDVEQDDVVERVAHLGGGGVDIAVDTTPHATAPVLDALRVLRPGGTAVLAGLKGRTVADFPTDEVAMRSLTVKGVRASGHHSVEQAVRLLESGRVPVERMHTHHFALEDAAEAVRTLGAPEAAAIAVTIEP